MTLDEAIKHCQEVAKQDCTECGKEHERLALWLTELMAFRATDNEPKVNRAEIMRLCNEIEDEVTDIAFNSTHYHIRDCCEAIRKYLKEIGNELTGDDSGGTRD